MSPHEPLPPAARAVFRLLLALTVTVAVAALHGPAAHAQPPSPSLAAPAVANPDPPLPAGGQPVLGAGVDPLAVLRPHGEPGGIEISRVEVAGQPFRSAVRVRTTGLTKWEYAVALAADVPTAVAKDDTLFVRFWARTVQSEDETGAGRFRVNLQQKVPTGESTAFFPDPQAAPGPDWQRFDIPRSARRGFAPDEARLLLGFGRVGPQTVEIGGFEMLNFGPQVSPSTLPFQRETYAGREPDAPWRRAADERIERHRKADLLVRVTDAATGQPVPGAEVRVRMLRHAYRFGTMVQRDRVLPERDNPQSIRYREELTRGLFNLGAVTNYWAHENPGTLQGSIAAARWLGERGMQARGHTLVWPGWVRLPAEVKQTYEATRAARGEAAAKAELGERVLARIRQRVADFRGLVTDWDVVNEPGPNSDLLKILGPEVMADWFKAAREADPDVGLHLNHNAILAGGNMDTVLGYVRMLQAKGAPITGVNEEGHVRPAPIARLLDNLDKLAALGLPIEITEYDLVTPDEGLQADYTRDYLTVMFAHPATTGFTMWGFWDGAHWLGDAPIFRKDWSLKPAGEAFRELVRKRWWTDATGPTDTQGDYRARGFLGDYEVTATHGGKTKTVRATLPRAGQPPVTATVQFD